MKIPAGAETAATAQLRKELGTPFIVRHLRSELQWWEIDPSGEGALCAESFGDKKISGITVLDCKQWAEKASDSQYNAARIMLSDLVSIELFDRNPLSKVKRKRSPGRRDYPPLSSKEVEGLLASRSSTNRWRRRWPGRSPTVPISD